MWRVGACKHRKVRFGISCFNNGWFPGKKELKLIEVAPLRVLIVQWERNANMLKERKFVHRHIGRTFLYLPEKEEDGLLCTLLRPLLKTE